MGKIYKFGNISLVEHPPEYEGEQFFSVEQEEKENWEYSRSELSTRIANLQAKEDAIEPGEEPEDEESLEWALWRKKKDRKKFLKKARQDFEKLLHDTPEP